MKKHLLIGSVVAGLAVAAAACGGGTSSSDKTATAAASKPTAAAAATKPAAVATTASTAAAEKTVEPKELANDVTLLKGILANVVTKAKAGDVQGTKDTEATMDDSMEATIKATRLVDPALADALEQDELAIEKEADATTTDLTVIAAKATDALAQIDKIVVALKLDVSAGAGPSAAELAKDIQDLKGIMNAVIAKANAGDVQGTRDTEGTMDDPIEAVVKALRPIDPALADQIEQRELAIEKEADASTTDVKAIAKYAGELLPLFDQAATALK